MEKGLDMMVQRDQRRVEMREEMRENVRRMQNETEVPISFNMGSEHKGLLHCIVHIVLGGVMGMNYRVNCKAR